MSRWSEAFAALSGGHDTIDTMRPYGMPPTGVSHTVNSVIPTLSTAPPPRRLTEANGENSFGGFSCPPIGFEDRSNRYGSAEPLHEPQWWRDEFEERAAMRQHGGLRDRAEAEQLAWGELQTRWHLSHGERVPADFCAGCGKQIGTSTALDQIDGARVHLTASYECLMRYGARWRAEATRALTAMGLEPPNAREAEL